MAGGGSIAGMIISIRNNAKLLRKKSMFKKESSFLHVKKEYLKAAEGKLDLKKATPHELKKVREVVKQNRRESRKLTLIALFVAAPLVLFVGYAIQTNASIYPQSTYADTKETDPNNRHNDYLFFIADGDKYLEEKKWHNAIFQYTEALKLFPREFDANYRLSLAYTYSCSFEGKNCDAAHYTLDKLGKEFPHKAEIKELKNILSQK